MTNGFLFKDPFVATGPCPNCGVENRVFFGDIFNLPGDHDESKVKCTNCKSELQVIRKTLRVTTTIKKESDLTGGIGNKKPAMAASASVGGADE